MIKGRAHVALSQSGGKWPVFWCTCSVGLSFLWTVSWRACVRVPTACVIKTPMMLISHATSSTKIGEYISCIYYRASRVLSWKGIWKMNADVWWRFSGKIEPVRSGRLWKFCISSKFSCAISSVKNEILCFCIVMALTKSAFPASFRRFEDNVRKRPICFAEGRRAGGTETVPSVFGPVRPPSSLKILSQAAVSKT